MLDWSRDSHQQQEQQQQRQDKLLSMMLFCEEGYPVSVIRPAFDHVSGEFEWDKEAREELEDYFTAYREICCTENDHFLTPLHQPQRQLSLLFSAAEQAASLRGSICIELEDVDMATLLGGVLLRNRYGRGSCLPLPLPIQGLKTMRDQHEGEQELPSSPVSSSFTSRDHLDTPKDLRFMVHQLQLALC